MKFAVVALVFCLALPAQSPVWSEDFEGLTTGLPDCLVSGTGALPQGWNDGGGTASWTVWSGPTPTPASGPETGNAGSATYLYCETSSTCAGGRFLMETAQIDVSSLSAPTLSLAAHLVGAEVGVLEVQQEIAPGFWGTKLRLIGPQGAGWRRYEVPLDGPSARLRFVYRNAAGILGDAGIDDLSIAEPPRPVELQTDSPASSLSVDGRPLREPCLSEFVFIDGRSTLIGAPFDWVVSVGPPIPRSAGAIATPGGQLINVPLAPGVGIPLFSTFLAAPLLHPGFYRASVFIGAEVHGCAQQIVLDPGNPDGFTVSRPIEVDSVAVAPSPGPFAGPGGDDDTLVIRTERPPVCRPLTFPFFGVHHEEVTIDSNGRLLFGLGSSDFSASPAEAAGGLPLAGFWTDLDPSSSGQITWDVIQDELIVTWDGVPYFGTSDTVTFSIGIAAGSGDVRFELAGVSPNTSALPGAAGDAQWLGISPGGGAPDPGALSFGLGQGVGLSGAMVHAWAPDPTAQPTSGLIASVAQLLTGQGQLLFQPRPDGGYDWVGQ